jgi:hypothetical protein
VRRTVVVAAAAQASSMPARPSMPRPPIGGSRREKGKGMAIS